MLGSRALLRRLLAAAAVVVLAVPAVPSPVTAGSPAPASAPAPKPPVVIAPPNVVATGPNVFQASPNGTVYYKPMAGRAPFDPIRTIGNLHNNEYHSPTDVVVVGAYLYVLDSGNGRFLKRRASDLAYVGQSSSLGAHTTFPYRIASDGTYLYVTDAIGGSIVVFRVGTMAYVGKYGSAGTGVGHFSTPAGIAVSSGRIYVVDQGNNRVVKLTTWPIAWVKSYGTVGAGTGHFIIPSGAAVIGSNLYVTDRGNNRIVRLSTALTGAGWLAKTSYGSPAIGFVGPDELATDGTYLYAYDSLNAALVKFTGGLAFVKKLAPSGATGWNSQMGMTATATALYLVHDGEHAGYRDQVTKDSLTTLAVTKVSGTKVPSADTWIVATSVAADAANTYVGDRSRILVCPRIGTGCTREITVSGNAYVTGIASDGTYLYVTDSTNSNVRKIDISTGAQVLSYGTSGAGNDQLMTPSGIAYSPLGGGKVFVLDRGNSRVVARLAADLTYSAQGGTPGSGTTQLSQPEGIAVSGLFLYIADTGNSRLVKWSLALGQAAATIAAAGSADGEFQNPQGVATDGDTVWVSDIQNANVQRFSVLNLAFLGKTTASGGKTFTSGNPNRVAAIDGRLLILDKSRSHVYEVWGGGPLKLSASPSDSTVPFTYSFDWSGSAPAGWSAPDSTILYGGASDRYFGWTPTAPTGSLGVKLSTLGDASLPTTVSFVPDSTPPVVDTPPTFGPQSPLGTSTSLLKALVFFGGSDAGSGLASALLQRSINGGAYATVMTWSAGAPIPGYTLAYNATVKTGTTYRFRTRLTDRVGNVSAWKYDAAFVASMVQENGLGVTVSSGWTRPAITGSIGGYVRTTSAASKTITITATMTELVVIGRVTPTGGSLKVYVDGVFLAPTSAFGSPAANRVLIALVPTGTKKVHKVKLVSVGDGPVYIDAFVVIR